MADRYQSEFDDELLDESSPGSRREGRTARGNRKRRIRIVENGMPDKPNSGYDGLLDRKPHDLDRPVRAVEYTEYETDADDFPQSYTHYDNDGYDEDRNLVKSPSQQREVYQQRTTLATGYHRGAARRHAISMPSRSRLPQLPIRGGLSDLVGRGRVVMALLMAVLAFVGYNVSRTDEAKTRGQSTVAPQEISLLAEHDIALGQKSVRQMLARHGGISRDQDKRNIVQQIGARLVQSNEAACAAYQFTFDVLSDRQSINTYALPGGHVYVTAALLRQLKSEGEIAGVLAHEMAHVTQRHGVSRLANTTLADGNSGAVVMASFLDPVQFQPTSGDVSELIAETVQLQYEAAEVQNSDQWAVYYMSQAGFNPEMLVTALQRVTLWDGQPTDFALRHQPPENQLAMIQQQIQQRFPQGVPTDFVR